MAESGAPETITVWRAFRDIYGLNLGVEQPICGDQTARAVVHCSLCTITQRFFLRFPDKARIRIDNHTTMFARDQRDKHWDADPGTECVETGLSWAFRSNSPCGLKLKSGF
jgi:hypothetical protein